MVRTKVNHQQILIRNLEYRFQPIRRVVGVYPELKKTIEVIQMIDLQPTSEKLASVQLSRDAAITSSRHEVMRQLRFLLIRAPLAVMVVGSLLGFLTAPNPCNKSLICSAEQVFHSTKQLLNPVQAFDSQGPDVAKLPYVLAIAFLYIYVFSVAFALLYALCEFAVALRVQGKRRSDAG